MFESISIGHIAKISNIIKDLANWIYSIFINRPNVEFYSFKVRKVT
jgi:hypothetical protein